MLRKIVFVFSLFGIFLLPLTSSSDPPNAFGEAGNQFWIKVKGYLGEEAGRYIIYADVSSNLPSDTLIEGAVYYAKKIPAPRAVKEETGQEYEIEKILLAKGTERVKEDACLIKMGFFLRVPYAGEYIIIVRFNPQQQTQLVQTKLPSDTKPFEQEISFTYGSQEDLEHQKKEVSREIYGVLERMKGLYDDLQREVEAQHQLTKFDAERWGKWIGEWENTIKVMEQDNQARLEQRIYWLESTGKSAIKELCKRLVALAQQYPKLVETSEDAHKDFLKYSMQFSMSFTDYLYQLGYEMIIDKTRVQEILKALGKNYTALRDTYHKVTEEETPSSQAEWINLIMPYKSQIERQLLDLVQETPDYIFATYTIGLSQNILSYVDECAIVVTESASPKRKIYIKQLEKKIDQCLEELNRALDLR